MVGTETAFLQDLAVVMVVAAITTVIFHRLRQPVVLGYLLAGIVVGPFTPPFAFVQDRVTIQLLGELGVIFLLFALGLEFNIHKLRKVGATALVAGVLETSLMIWLGYTVGRAFGFDHIEAVFLGAIVSISSTTIIVKVLTELGQKDEEWAEVIFGILIIEDILAVLILTVLSTAGATGTFSTAAVGTTLLGLAVFLGSALVIGLVVVPRLVTFVAKVPVEEVLTVSVLGLAFGMSILAGRLGFSTALGAFIMGALIAESAAASRVEQRIVPIRDLFTAIFFVTVGMLLDPAVVVENWALILVVTAAVIVGKVVAATFATFVTGYEPQKALRVGFGLAQIGEFSFIIATLALALDVTDAPLYAVAVSVSALTAFATPVLYRRAPSAAAAFERRAPRPLRTYASLYGAWVRRLRELGANDPARRHARHVGMMTGLYGTVLVAIAGFGAASVESVSHAVAARVPSLADVAEVAGWTAVGIAILPFGILFVLSLRSFVGALAAAALPDRFRESASGRNVQLVLRRTFFLAGIVLFGSLLLVITSPFVPALPLLGIVGVAIAASAFLLYNSLVRFHRRVDSTLSEVLTAESHTPHAVSEERGEILSLIREAYPWDVEAKEVRVPPNCWGVNRSLRDLRLRSASGATVVSIRRGGDYITNPPPEMIIAPGDTLVLMGEDSQVETARKLILREGEDAVSPAARPTTWREVPLAAGSRLVDRTLAGARLRERTGATVVGVVRDGERIQNPAADFRLADGDVLLVVGAPTQIQAVERAAGEGEDDEEEMPS